MRWTPKIRDLAIGGAALLALFFFTAGEHMLPGQVEAVRTKLTRSQARAALQSAFRSIIGRAPSSAELAMLTAQSALETGNWNAMWNWNWGNVTTHGVPWFTLGKEKTVGAHKYRPFDSAEEGAAFFVSFLSHHYPEAFALLGSGDTVAFASALKSRGYFEADPARYAVGLDSRYSVA